MDLPFLNASQEINENRNSEVLTVRSQDLERVLVVAARGLIMLYFGIKPNRKSISKVMAKIRNYSPDDLNEVVKLFRSNLTKYFVEAEEKELRDFLAEYSEDYYVVEIIDEIVAAGGIALNPDQTISLCWAMVRNDLLGTGLGKELTLFRMEKGREKWGDLPFFTSTSQHTEGFYKKLGFHTVEHIPNGFAPGIDTCKMRLEPVTSLPSQVQEELPV